MAFPVFASKQQARIDSVPPSIPITIGRVVVVGDDEDDEDAAARASVAMDTTRISSRSVRR